MNRQLISLFLLATPLVAQNVAGSLTGLVQDASGAVMADVTITVTNPATNISFKTKTSSSGEYTAPNLNPGSYEIVAETPGFRPSKVTDARLLANRTLRVDFTLEPGAITQSVEVQAAAPVVNSESATIGNIMEAQTITTLPLNGRTLTV